MANTVHVLDLVDKPLPVQPVKIFAMMGMDSFLRQQAFHAVIDSLKVNRDSIRSFDGNEISWRDVHDYLATRSLFDDDGYRIAYISSADSFVTDSRPTLESWIDSKSQDASLILDVKKMPSNTKIYKAIQKLGGIVDCSIDIPTNGKSPDDPRILKWIVKWAKHHHQIHVTDVQANLILERVGYVFGIIDCELAKMALFADDASKVSDSIVKELVGGWRTKTVWDIADLIADGKIGAALEQLDGLFRSGQHVLAIVGPLSWHFRRYGVAANLIDLSERTGKRIPMKTALTEAGFKFKLEEAERRLTRIGRHRSKNLLNWLKELDVKLKGTHSMDDRGRFALEEFLLKLS